MPSTVSDQLVPVETLQPYKTNENALGSPLFDVALCCSVIGVETQRSGNVSLEYLRLFPKANNDLAHFVKNQIIGNTRHTGKIGLFPKCRGLAIIGTDSSDDDHDCLEQMVLNLERDVGDNATSRPSSSDRENQTDLVVDVGDFVIAKIHISQCRGHPKNFVGKICERPDEDNEYEINFLRKPIQIKDGFIFSDAKDIASVVKALLVKNITSPTTCCSSKSSEKSLAFCY